MPPCYFFIYACEITIPNQECGNTNDHYNADADKVIFITQLGISVKNVTCKGWADNFRQIAKGADNANGSTSYAGWYATFFHHGENDAVVQIHAKVDDSADDNEERYTHIWKQRDDKCADTHEEKANKHNLTSAQSIS